MFKNLYFRLGLISTVSALSLLIVLPRIPLKVDNSVLKLNSYIGGYQFNIFGKDFDLSGFKRGLDLNGGVRVVLEANLEGINPSDHDAAIESAVEVLERRVNLLGVSEPYVAPIKSEEGYKIIVEIPGVENVSEAIELVGQTAQLKFYTLNPDLDWYPETLTSYIADKESWVDTGISGADLRGADVVFSQDPASVQANRPQIQLRFTEEGLDKFSEVASQNVNRPIAIYLDDVDLPLSVAEVSEELANGVVDDPIISGNFDLQQAQALSVQIRAGALPISVEIVEQKNIGATLGAESINKSLFAGVVGLIFVLIFMIYMYKRLGILAAFSLLIYTTITLAIFKLIPVVLTMPGIAGLILSIGMAADANILIFERTKEEILWGKPSNLAIKLGFERAWSSIRDSNFSSLITSYILYEFGSGPVKGFALTLAIGIIVSLFSSIFVVKTLVEVFSAGKVEASK